MTAGVLTGSRIPDPACGMSCEVKEGKVADN